MVTEYAPKGRRGFYGSWPQVGFAGGLLISTVLIAVLTNVMSDDAFASWGWRVPFFLSGVLVAVGLWIRLKIEETPAFTQLEEKQKREKMPAVEVFKEYPKDILRAIGMRCSENITFYMLITFSPLLRRGRSRHLPQHAARRHRRLRRRLVHRRAVLRQAVRPHRAPSRVPVGRHRLGAAGHRLLPAAQDGSAVIIIFAFVLVMNTAHDAQYAVESSYFAEMFPTRLRYSGISISAQLGGVFAGAFAPLIATALADVGGLTLAVAYFTVMCAISAVAAYLSPETYKVDFLGKPEPSGAQGRFVREPRPTERVGA